MNQPVRTTSPGGEPIVILSADAYDRLVRAAEDHRDSRVADRALADHRADPGQALTSEEMNDLLAAATPLAFWRRKRRLSQTSLAKLCGCSQPYLQQIETGKRAGTLATVRKLAKALGVSVIDLVPDAEGQGTG